MLLVAGDKAGNWRALVRHEDPIAEYRYGRMDQETGRRMSEKKPSAQPWSAVKRDAVASGAMAPERPRGGQEAHHR